MRRAGSLADACDPTAPFANESVLAASASMRLVGGEQDGWPAWARPAFEGIVCEWAHRLRQRACAAHEACPFHVGITQCRRASAGAQLECAPEPLGCGGAASAAERYEPPTRTSPVYCRNAYNKHATSW